MWYRWTSPQRPSWVQKKVAVVEPSGLNKSQCLDCPSKKAAVVERWPFVEVRLYNTGIGIRTTLYRSLIATSVNNWIMFLIVQGHPTSVFGKYLFGRRFEIRNICCKISCLPASPRIFEHLKNGIIAHFQRVFTLKRSPRIFGSLFSRWNFRKGKFWSLSDH